MGPPQAIIYKDNASTDPPLYIIVLEELFWNYSFPECASHELDMHSKQFLPTENTERQNSKAVIPIEV